MTPGRIPCRASQPGGEYGVPFIGFYFAIAGGVLVGVHEIERLGEYADPIYAYSSDLKNTSYFFITSFAGIQ